MPKFHGYAAKHIIIDPNEPYQPGQAAGIIWNTLKSCLDADTIYLMWPLIKADAERYNFDHNATRAAEQETIRTRATATATPSNPVPRRQP